MILCQENKYEYGIEDKTHDIYTITMATTEKFLENQWGNLYSNIGYYDKMEMKQPSNEKKNRSLEEIKKQTICEESKFEKKRVKQ